MPVTAIRPVVYAPGSVPVRPHIMLAYDNLRVRLDGIPDAESPRIQIYRGGTEHTAAAYPKLTGSYHLSPMLWNFTTTLVDTPLGEADDRLLTLIQMWGLWDYHRSKSTAYITLDDYVDWYTEYVPTGGTLVRQQAPWTAPVKTSHARTGGNQLGYYGRFWVHFNNPPIIADYRGKTVVQLSFTEAELSCQNTTVYSYP